MGFRQDADGRVLQMDATTLRRLRHELALEFCREQAHPPTCSSVAAIKPIEMGQWESNDVISEWQRIDVRTSCGRERLSPGAPDKKRKRLSSWMEAQHLPQFSFSFPNNPSKQ